MGQTSENLELFYDAGKEGRHFGVRYHLGSDVRVCPHTLTVRQIRALVDSTRGKAELVGGYISLHHPELWGWLRALPARPGFQAVAMLGAAFTAFMLGFGSAKQ